MTKRTDSPLDRNGAGRGKKIVTVPIRKKRGANAKPESVESTIANNRSKYRSAANIPIAEIADTIDPDKPLTEKAKLFVKHWAQGESIQAAAVKAGYGDHASYAYRLVHFPQAKALYAEEKRLYEEAAQMSRKKVMDMLVEAYDMAKLTSEPSSMVSAAREIGKMCGYYEPTKIKIEHSVIEGVARMERLTDAELMEMIRNGANPGVDNVAPPLLSQ